MAMREYLKSAAAQLRRAAQARKDEMDGLRRDMQNLESSIGSQINDLRRQEQLRSSQSLGVDTPDERNRQMAEITRLKNEESEMRNDVKNRKDETSQIMKQMESDVNRLNQQAADLEKQAGFM